MQPTIGEVRNGSESHSRVLCGASLRLGLRHLLHNLMSRPCFLNAVKRWFLTSYPPVLLVSQAGAEHCWEFISYTGAASMGYAAAYCCMRDSSFPPVHEQEQSVVVAMYFPLSNYVSPPGGRLHHIRSKASTVSAEEMYSPFPVYTMGAQKLQPCMCLMTPFANLSHGTALIAQTVFSNPSQISEI